MNSLLGYQMILKLTFDDELIDDFYREFAPPTGRSGADKKAARRAKKVLEAYTEALRRGMPLRTEEEAQRSVGILLTPPLLRLLSFLLPLIYRASISWLFRRLNEGS